MILPVEDIVLEVVLVTFSLISATAQAPESNTPRIVPFFSRVDNSPGFFVECRNNTGRAVPSNSDMWAWAPNRLRIDGQPFVESGGIIGPGLSTMIEPGGVWRGIYTLRQAAGGIAPAVAFGANTRGGRIVPLTPGRHTIAVQCGEEWSADYEFYWEPAGQ